MLPYDFEDRVEFVREGEFNAPDLIKPARVEQPKRLPGQRKGAKELVQTEHKLRRFGTKVSDWDSSVAAYNVEYAFAKLHKSVRNFSYDLWRNQQTRMAKMRSSSLRQLIISKVIEDSLKKNLHRPWFCREEHLVFKRNWTQLEHHNIINRFLPLHHQVCVCVCVCA